MHAAQLDIRLSEGGGPRIPASSTGPATKANQIQEETEIEQHQWSAQPAVDQSLTERGSARHGPAVAARRGGRLSAAGVELQQPGYAGGGGGSPPELGCVRLAALGGVARRRAQGEGLAPHCRLFWVYSYIRNLFRLVVRLRAAPFLRYL